MTWIRRSRPRRETASRAVYEAVLETVAGGVRTSDLGGHSSTTEFTDSVIELVRPQARRLGLALGPHVREAAEKGRFAAGMEAGQLTGTGPGRSTSVRSWASDHPAWIAVGVMVVISIVLIIGDGLQLCAQRTLNGLVSGSYFALGAIGLTLVYGILKLVNFAHGDMLTFGAYIAFLFNVTIGHAAGAGAGDRDRGDRGAWASSSS